MSSYSTVSITPVPLSDDVSTEITEKLCYEVHMLMAENEAYMIELQI